MSYTQFASTCHNQWNTFSHTMHNSAKQTKTNLTNAMENTKVYLKKTIEKMKPTAIKALKKVKEFAILTFKCGFIAFCFWTNPSLFAISFFVGICWSNQVKRIIDKIKIVVQQHKWPILAVCGVGAFLSLPVAMAVTTSLTAAHLGHTFYETALQYSKGEKKQKRLKSYIF